MYLNPAFLHLSESGLRRMHPATAGPLRLGKAMALLQLSRQRKWCHNGR